VIRLLLTLAAAVGVVWVAGLIDPAEVERHRKEVRAWLGDRDREIRQVVAAVPAPQETAPVEVASPPQFVAEKEPASVPSTEVLSKTALLPSSELVPDSASHPQAEKAVPPPPRLTRAEAEEVRCRLDRVMQLVAGDTR
jgi:hypothetical protein